MTPYTVLLYHGVHADNLSLDGLNSSGKHIPASRFRSEMEWLKANRPLVSMVDIDLAYRGAVNIPADAVAVTFDDGFHNVIEHAVPVLRELDIPWTWYLATGLIRNAPEDVAKYFESPHRVTWTDRLEAAIIHGPNYQGRSIENRIAVLNDAKSTLKAMKRYADVLQIVDTICGDFKLDHPLYRFVSWNDLRGDIGLCSLGAHTVNHAPLGRCDNWQWEIEFSLKTVSHFTGKQCRLFSYPEGLDGDFYGENIVYLKRFGITHCPTAIEGTNTVERTDPFRIRRSTALP